MEGENAILRVLENAMLRWSSQEPYKSSHKTPSKRLLRIVHTEHERKRLYPLSAFPHLLRIAPLGVYSFMLLVVQLNAGWTPLKLTSHMSQRSPWKEASIQELISDDGHWQKEVGQNLYSSVHHDLAGIRGMAESCINLDR